MIAVVCDAIYPYSHGGRELRYHELTRRLANHADIHIYTMRWWKGSRVYSQGAITFHAITPCLPLYTKGRRSIRQALIFALSCACLLWARFDILEADHMPYFQLFVLRLVSMIRRKRFVVIWHEVWGPAYWRQYLGMMGWGAWAVEWLGMRLPKHIVAASPQTAERLNHWVGKRATITSIPNGIDLKSIRMAQPSREAVDLLMVGRLMDHKRVDMGLDVIACLRDRGVLVTARVIGKGPERNALHARAEKLKISDLVDFRHNIEDQQHLYAYMKAAKVFLSLSAREGFGIAVLEAMACGLPVITTNDTDNLARHLVRRSSDGIVCSPTTEAVADAVEGMLADAPLHRSQNIVIPPWMADYDWSAIAEQMRSVYEDH